MPDDEKPYLIAAWNTTGAGPCRVPEELLNRRLQLGALIEQHQRSLAITQRELDMRTVELATLDFAIKAIEEQEGSADVRARTTGKRRNLRQVVLDEITAQVDASVEELVERTGLRARAVSSAVAYLLSKDKIEPTPGQPDLYRPRHLTVNRPTTESIDQ